MTVYLVAFGSKSHKTVIEPVGSKDFVDDSEGELLLLHQARQMTHSLIGGTLCRGGWEDVQLAMEGVLEEGHGGCTGKWVRSHEPMATFLVPT